MCEEGVVVCGELDESWLERKELSWLKKKWKPVAGRSCLKDKELVEKELVGKTSCWLERRELVGKQELVEESVQGQKTSREESRVFGVDRRTVERTRPVGVRDRVFGVDRQRTRARESPCRRDTSDASEPAQPGKFFFFCFLFTWVFICASLCV